MGREAQQETAANPERALPRRWRESREVDLIGHLEKMADRTPHSSQPP
ncbi:hypothetical protein AS9A_P20025 (plasmid) [Hoyosella subflava DQS3-9A1]|uniref:Uncharacterized protein n=1 Tax=Hoyosella subflava (strain DSM 45089 / JCM 17490 / NBRC 109087 / DQS3-9A1) TaxID=443218 RepID=F6ESE8_HOYSD|nr:hypothetical protein AS9A_P20025 [Hoyosella subflava DQS3-9A1]